MSRLRPAVHALALHPDGTLLPGQRAAELPAGALDSLPGLLGRVAPLFDQHGQGVVVLTDAAARQLGYPDEPPKSPTAAREHPVLTAPRAAGWRITGLAGWQTFWSADGSRPSVHVAVHPWLSPKTGPLLDADPFELAYHLHRYHELTGTAYHATPGVTGIGLLRDGFSGRTVPYWSPDDRKLPAGTRAAEADITWVSPDAPAHPVGYRHKYDANRMYLAVAGTVTLASGELRHTPRARLVGYDDPPGYWRIEWPQWHESRLPSPLGWRRTRSDKPLWITTPTLRLLTELADLKEPLCSAPVVLDAWTATGSRIMRRWAETLTAAFTSATAGAAADPHDVRQLQALKATYKETIGMLARADSRVYRPDWRHTIIAAARCSLWRKVWRVAEQTGRWPASVQTDAVSYDSPNRDPIAACPAPLQLGPAGGQFKVQT